MSGIILFDGVCNFCSQSVQFILKRDKTGYFSFASLQSKTGQQLLKKHHVKTDIDSLVVIENGRYYVESEAALRIARQFNGCWKLLTVLRFIPAPVRDFMYRFVAKNRYKWFGAQTSCMLPPDKVKHRFLM